MQGKPEAASRSSSRTSVQSVEAGLAHQEAQALTNMGVARLHLRDFKGAEVRFHPRAQRAGAADTRDHAIALENLAVLAHWQRDFATAQARYYDAVTLLKRLGNKGHARARGQQPGRALRRHGRPHARAYAVRVRSPGGRPQPVASVVVAEGLLLAWSH
jgi:hypothetical protein